MKFVDLTLPIDNKIPTFPGDPVPEIKQFLVHEKDGVNVSTIFISSHFSTHLDSAFHFVPDGKKLDEYPIEKFVGDGILVDVRGEEIINSDLKNVKEDDIVLFLTEHTHKINSNEFFENPPIISMRTAKMLVEKKVKMVGIDSFSPDSEPFDVHKLLLRNDILIIENVINLDKLIKKKFKVFAFPLKLHTDGSPCRVIASIEE